MGIDWFTFGAQIVNFLILIGLLWRFAYQPILRAMDQREASIRGRLEDAAQQRAQAEEKSAALDRKHQELEAQRADLLARARQEADQRRQELVAEARQRVESSESQWRSSLRRQKQQLADELSRRAERHVVSAIRRLLREMADEKLESRMVDVFVARLREADDDTARDVRQALADAGGEVTVVSGFALADDQRARLRAQVQNFADREVQPRFETDDDLLCGLELRVGDRSVAWNAADYLRELAARIEEAIASAALEESQGREQNEGPAAHDAGDDGNHRTNDEATEPGGAGERATGGNERDAHV